MCGNSSTSPTYEKRHDRPSRQHHITAQPKAPPRMTFDPYSIGHSNSETTLVNPHPGAVSTASLQNGGRDRTDTQHQTKQAHAGSSQAQHPQDLLTRLERDAKEADRWHQPYNVFNQFSNRQEGTKFSKLGIGQLIMKNKIRPNEIFEFTKSTGGHRCLICNRLIQGVPQSAALVRMSGPEAKLPHNIHNIICRGDCFVRLHKDYLIDCEKG
jgi:hypothetical protein